MDSQHCRPVKNMIKGIISRKVGTFGRPSATSNLSATNSMYRFIKTLFIPIKATGNASVRNYKQDNFIVNIL